MIFMIRSLVRYDFTNNGIFLVDPFGHLDFLNLMLHSKFIMTDSGGIQEQTTVLGIPFLTLRKTTKRPIAITQGTNVLVWNDTQKIGKEALKALDGQDKKVIAPSCGMPACFRVPEFGNSLELAIAGRGRQQKG